MNTTIDLNDTRALVDAYLEKICAARKQQAAKIGSRYIRFWDEIERSMLAGGKRIRPYLTMIGYGAVDKRVLPVAVAQELIHVAMLMHDDVIDQDDIRHGVANVQGAYREAYSPYLDPARARHYSYGAGILAGDALISEAYKMVYASGFGEHIQSQVIAQLHTSIYEVIGGELLDVEAAFITDEIFDPMQVYRYKTSSYSFIGPLLSGAYCGGVGTDEIERLRAFATAAGIAYQIQDDILGVFGDEASTGKSTLTDLREGKQTLLISYYQAAMDEADHDLFRYFGDEQATDEVLAQIKHAIRTSGALDKAKETAAAYFSDASEQLAQLEAGSRREALTELLERLKQRNA